MAESGVVTISELPPKIGNRIVVTGMAGAGKSTFSRRLATETGLPLIHLDLYRWDPGWVLVPQHRLFESQRTLLAADCWIIDSNDVDEALLLKRADTLIVLLTPWWLCSVRAFRRGLRRPKSVQLPEGCEESFKQRIGDEWGIVWRNWRNRNAVRQGDLALAARCNDQLSVHVLRTKPELTNFLDSL